MNFRDTFFEVEDLMQNITNEVFDNRLIHIKGKAGSGKTFLAKSIYEEISNWENWSSYYICGLSPDIEAYATINNSINKNKSTISEIGFSLSPIVSLGASVSFSHAAKKDFSPFEYSIVNNFLKAYGDNLLIIADDYHLWDAHSIHLLNTLILQPQIFLQSKKNLHVILITDIKHGNLLAQYKKEIINFPVHIMHVLDTEGLRNFLTNNFDYIKKISDNLLSYIISLTGGNMSMIKWILDTCQDKVNEYMNSDDAHEIINNLATYRIQEFCEHLSEKSIDADEILEIAALYEKGFTVEEIAFISKQNTITILDVLSFAEQENLIKDLPPYIFSCAPIRNVLIDKAKVHRKYYYEKQYDYMLINTPGSYYQRAICLSKFSAHNPDIIYLYAMAYSRSVLLYMNEEMRNKILQKMELYILDNSNSNDVCEAKYQFEKFQEIITCIHLGNYQNAYNNMMNFPRTANILIESEIYLLKIFCFTLFQTNTCSIKDLVEESLDILELIYEKKEYDQYVRMLLTILPILIDKINDVDKFNELRRKLNRELLSDNHNYFLQYAQATMQRKASLYKSYDTAYADSAQAIHFFHKHGMETDKYFALCNHSGNLIVRNNYNDAIKSVQEAIMMQKNNPYLPSKEKVINNLIMAKLLKTEDEFRKGYISYKVFSQRIEKYTAQLEFEIVDDSDGNLVVSVNRCSLLAYMGKLAEAQQVLSKLQGLLQDNNDDFYIYFITNIKLGIAIINGNWPLAEKYLLQLDFVPALFTKAERLIKKRYEIIQKIVFQRQNYNSVEYNFAIYDKLPRFSDDSWVYFSRGFPISDLQFNSQ